MCLLAMDGLLEFILLLWVVVQGVLSSGYLCGIGPFWAQRVVLNL